MAELELLMDMGFSKERAEQALSVTGHKGVEPAAEWLLSHPEGEDSSSGHYLGSDDSIKKKDDQEGVISDTSGATPLQPLSLKCDDCGKLLRSELEAQTHAARTQHTNFSESTEEIKPLTEEEKKEQLAKIEERIRQKRAEREVQEKTDALEREKVRRKTGQEITQIKHQMELKEAKKIADQKKREKMEDRLARQKVKEEIARDRAERASREKTEKQTQNSQASATPPATAVAPKKEYDTCKLQIRLFGGKTLINTFNATDTMIDVNRYILMNRTDDGTPFVLMTTFPRHIFTAEDSNKTLKELGLLPSAVVILTKPQQ